MQNLSFFLLDLAASFMLAAAASCRARSTGAHFSGAAVLACLAGMAAPLARDGLLGYGSLVLMQGEYLAASVGGGIVGVLAGQSGRAWPAFFWFDALGLALAVGVGTVRGAVFGLGLAGSLVLGLVAALVGGLVRDMCLGDIARAVEEDLYATAAALGGMFALALLVLAHLSHWQCAAIGAALTLLLRWGRRNKTA